MPLAVDDLTGADYLSVLSTIHSLFRPKTYLEIGTRSGDSLRLANCASISIDPSFKISSDVIGSKSEVLFVQDSSDAFFVSTHRRGLSIDLAFIDGLHLFEVVLRDIINVERHARKSSIIALHDCLPTDVHYTSRFESDVEYRRRGRHPNWWTGDVWKVILILQKYRPDLKVLCLDAAPTGLALVCNLDSENRLLETSYLSIVREWADTSLESYTIERFFSEVGVTATSEVTTLEGFSRHFRLL